MSWVRRLVVARSIMDEHMLKKIQDKHDFHVGCGVTCVCAGAAAVAAGCIHNFLTQYPEKVTNNT